jgi:hypothetical protein
VSSERVERGREVEVVVLDGEAVLFHRGRVHRLDLVGTRVWAMLDGTTTLDDLARELGREFDEGADRVRADIGAFLAHLGAEGLLEPGPPPPHAPGAASAPRRTQPPEGARCYEAMAFRFSLQADNEIGRYLHELFGQFSAADGSVDASYELTREVDEATVRFIVRRNGEIVLTTTRAWLAIAWMLWDTNQRVILHEREHVLVHAAALSIEDRAVVIPARMGSGKSTLAASLALRGFRYLTDEAAAIRLGQTAVTPYPRTMALATSTQALLPELRPTPSWRSRYQRRQWHVTASQLGGAPGPATATVSAVVALELRPGEPSALTQISRSEAFESLCRNAWNLAGLGDSGFRTLGQAVAGAACARLTFGDIPSAVEAVRGLLVTDRHRV